MKVSPKDMPKVVMLLMLIGGFAIFISYTVMSNRKPQVAQNSPASNIVAGNPKRTAQLDQPASPEDYKEQIEAWSRPPAAQVTVNPFRLVLPSDIMKSLAYGRNHQSMPQSQITGSGTFGPGTGVFDPTHGGLPDVRIDFPTVTVQGVIVDTSSGTTTNFATVLVDNGVHFVKEGDPLGNDLVVERVTLRGVQIRAAKEHAFIEISKSYKPNGMAPPAPPKAARHRRSR